MNNIDNESKSMRLLSIDNEIAQKLLELKKLRRSRKEIEFNNTASVACNKCGHHHTLSDYTKKVVKDKSGVSNFFIVKTCSKCRKKKNQEKRDKVNGCSQISMELK